MRVTWYGHACFRLEGSGVSVVTDPYTPELAGLLTVSTPADVVVMSLLYEARPVEDFLAHRAGGPVVRQAGAAMEIDA